MDRLHAAGARSAPAPGQQRRRLRGARRRHLQRRPRGHRWGRRPASGRRLGHRRDRLGQRHERLRRGDGGCRAACRLEPRTPARWGRRERGRHQRRQPGLVRPAGSRSAGPGRSAGAVVAFGHGHAHRDARARRRPSPTTAPRQRPPRRPSSRRRPTRLPTPAATPTPTAAATSPDPTPTSPAPRRPPPRPPRRSRRPSRSRPRAVAAREGRHRGGRADDAARPDRRRPRGVPAGRDGGHRPVPVG